MRLSYGFSRLCKPRNEFGGGAAILIMRGLNYTEDYTLNKHNLELAAINLKLSGKEIGKVALYNPPKKIIKNVFWGFDQISTLFVMWRSNLKKWGVWL